MGRKRLVEARWMIGIPFRTEEERARLQAAADERFTTIGEFVRAAVLEKIDREKSLQINKTSAAVEAAYSSTVSPA
jgi:1,2-phenylacetyl-CoA epoxidase catalytic subunit